MRSDALRRRESLLRAARRLFAERGRDVPLEAVADEAGVGIATLYRNFGSREELVQAVTFALLTDLSRAARSATTALAVTGPSAVPAKAVWERLVDDLVALELGALAQSLAVKEFSDLTPEVRQAQVTTVAELQAALTQMKSHGFVREDLTALDVVLGIGLVTRPLPEAITKAAPDLTRRMVSVLVAGMAAS